MGLLSGLARAGVAKKIFDEARKPQNQEKAKQLYRKVRGKDDGGAGDGTDPGTKEHRGPRR